MFLPTRRAPAPLPLEKPSSYPATTNLGSPDGHWTYTDSVGTRSQRYHRAILPKMGSVKTNDTSFFHSPS